MSPIEITVWNSDGTKWKDFDSCTDAANRLGVQRDFVARCLKNPHLSVKGRYVRPLGAEFIAPVDGRKLYNQRYRLREFLKGYVSDKSRKSFTITMILHEMKQNGINQNIPAHNQRIIVNQFLKRNISLFDRMRESRRDEFTYSIKNEH